MLKKNIPYGYAAMKHFSFALLLFLGIINSSFAMQSKQNGFRFSHKINIKNKGLAAMISPCGNYAVSGGKDGILTGCDIRNPENTKTKIYRNNNMVMECIAFSKHSKYLALGNFFYKTVHVFNRENTKEKIQYSHNGVPQKVIFDQNKKIITSMANYQEETEIIRYDFANKTDINHIIKKEGNHVTLSPCGTLVVLVWEKNIIMIFDITKEQSKCMCTYTHDTPISDIAFGKDSKQIIFAASNNNNNKINREIALLDIKTKKLIYSHKQKNVAKKFQTFICKKDALVLSNNKKYIVAYENNKIIIFDRENNQVDTYTHDKKITQFDISHCNRYVASASADKQIKLFDLRTKKIKCSYKHNTQVGMIRFSTCVTKFSSIDWDGQVLVWILPNLAAEQDLKERVSFLDNYTEQNMTSFTVQLFNTKLQCNKMLLSL